MTPTATRKAVGAGAAGAAGLAAVWLLGRAGVSLSAEEGLVVGGFAVSAGRYLGKHGIKGALQQLWSGSAA